MNNLYKAFGGNDFMSRFNQFKSQFQGNPQQQIQSMLQTGQITQEQLNEAQTKARNFI